MKKLLIVISTALLAACGSSTKQNANSFTVGVKAEGANEVSISKVEGSQVSESNPLVLKDGVYSFDGVAEVPSYYSLLVDGKQYMLMLENGDNIVITPDDETNYSLEGDSEGSKLIKEVNEGMIVFYKSLEALQASYSDLVQNASEEERAAIVNQFDVKAGNLLDSCTNWLQMFIDDHINSPVSIMALYQQISGLKFLNMDEHMEYFEKVAESMQSLYPTATFTTQLVSDITTEKKYAVGAMVPEFSLPNQNGEMINVNQFKGKVTLIDFWASWCGPCRKESPNLVRAYRRFNDKGFEILSVSLDGTPRQKEPKQSWIGAIEKDGLEKWTHVSDLQGWNTVVRPLFNFNSIPHTVLINAEGKIIAKNLRGQALEEKLEAIFAS